MLTHIPGGTIDPITMKILVENHSCRDKDSTIKYLKTLATHPENISQLIDVIDQSIKERGHISIGENSRFLGLMQLLSHLRNPKTTLDDPFTEEVLNQRSLNVDNEELHNELEIFMPDEGETQFIRFVFSNNDEDNIYIEHDWVMECVDAQGFADYITGEIREE
jgi:hypothetical protein